MKKLALSVMFGWILTLGAAEAGTPTAQTFYKDPQYSSLEQVVKEELAQTINEKTLNLSTIFMAQVLRQHPDYLEKYAQTFSKLSYNEKVVFLRGVRSANLKCDLLKDISDKNLQQFVNDPKIMTLSELDHLKVKNAGDLDYLWGSFFATGNKKYIQQIVEVVNRDDETLVLAYEWMNRDFIKKVVASASKKPQTSDNKDRKDLIDYIEKRSKEKKDFKDQFFTTLAAFWSLDANSRQDPIVNQIIQDIIKDNPSLDYWAKIKKLV